MKKRYYTKNTRGEESETMKTKTAKMLPKTAGEIPNGGLYSQRVRCGKANCKCTRGEFHTAFYFFTRRNKKLVKIYIRKSEIEGFTGLVRQSVSDRKQNRQTSKSNFALLKEMRQMLRERNQLIKFLKGDSSL